MLLVPIRAVPSYERHLLFCTDPDVENGCVGRGRSPDDYEATATSGDRNVSADATVDDPAGQSAEYGRARI